MLQEGDLIPDITLTDDTGKPVRLHDFIEQKPMVVFFYPKNFTPGCIKESCEFRDYHSEFAGLGAEVLGISGDSSKSHAKFKSKYNLEYTLLSDSERMAERAFGVKRNFLGLLPGRVTFVTDKKGIIRFVFDSPSNPRRHVSETLTFLRDLIKL